MLSSTPTPASALANTYIKLPTIYRVLERSPQTTSSGSQTPNDYSTHSTPVLPFHAPAAFERHQHAFSVTPSQQRLLQAASSYLPTPSSSSRASVSNFNPQMYPPPTRQDSRRLTPSMESSRDVFRGRSSYPQGWDSLASIPPQSRAGLAGVHQPTGYRSLSGVESYAAAAFPTPSQIRQSRQTLQGNEPLLASISRGSVTGISMPGQPSLSQLASPVLPAIQRPQLQNGNQPRSRKDLLTSLSTHSQLGSYVQRQNLSATPLLGLNALSPRTHRYSLPSGIPQHNLYTHNLNQVELSASSFGLDSLHPFQPIPPHTASASLSTLHSRQLSTARAPRQKQDPYKEDDASEGQSALHALLLPEEVVEASGARGLRTLTERSDVEVEVVGGKGQYLLQGPRGVEHEADELERSIWLDSEEEDVLSDRGQDRGEAEEVQRFSTSQQGPARPILSQESSQQHEQELIPRVSRVFRYADASVTREGEVLELSETEHSVSLSESF